MPYIREHHLWRRPLPPPGLACWCPTMGLVDADTADRHRTAMDHPVPHLLLRGSGWLRHRGRRYALAAGDLFCLWPGESYEYGGDADTPWAFCWWHMTGVGATDYADALGFGAAVPTRRATDPGAALALAHRMLALWRAAAPASLYDAAGCLLQLLAVAGPPPASPASPPDLATEAEALMRSALHTGINLNEICASLGVNRATLQRAFRARRGCTPIDHLNGLRLERARELLAATDLTLDEIARMVGYASGKYLIRRCRVAYGVPPGQLRKRG